MTQSYVQPLGRCYFDNVQTHHDLQVIPTPFVERTMGKLINVIREDQVGLNSMACIPHFPKRLHSLMFVKCCMVTLQILVSCTKGILNDTLETPHDILKRVLPVKLHSG